MKKSILALITMGVAVTVMAAYEQGARYSVLSVKMNGTTIVASDHMGYYLENGEKTHNDQYIKKPVKLNGYLIADERIGWSTFIEVGTHYHTAWDAELAWDFDARKVNYAYIDSENHYDSETGTGYRHAFYKWREIQKLRLDQEGESIEILFSGRRTFAWKDVYEDYSYVPEKSWWNALYLGFGTGMAQVSDGPDGYIKTVKLKYNQRLSHSMDDAFLESGGETNETAGVAAAEEVLNDYINKQARTDDANYLLPKISD